MRINIFVDHLVSYIATGSAEIASAPKMPSPVFFTKFGKFLLDFSRRSTFGFLYKFANCYVRRYRDKYVQMLCRYYSIYNFNIHFLGNTGNNIPNAFTNFSSQNTVAIFGNPYQMVAMMIYSVRLMSVIRHRNNITEVSPVWKTGVSTV